MSRIIRLYFAILNVLVTSSLVSSICVDRSCQCPSQNTFEVNILTDPLNMGDGIHWDRNQQVLYFVDVTNNSIHKYVPRTGKHTKTKLGGRVMFIIPVEGQRNQFLVAVERMLQIVRWNGEEGTPATLVKMVGEVDQEYPTNRINDGKADPRGRVYLSTIGTISGSFYRLDGDTLTQVGSAGPLANGLVWDLKERAMYNMYYDRFLPISYIRRFDYNVETGNFCNLTEIFHFEDCNIPGFPDGVTLDSNGNLWVAAFNASSILNIDPRTGELLCKIPVPMPQPSSLTFGGPNYDILFVTSDNLSAESAMEPTSGTTFMITGLGVTGLRTFAYKAA